MLYYLSGYLFTVLGAFAVICLVMRHLDSEDISSLSGLNQRAPLLAVTMTLAMVSLAGIPPLAGFFGKFLLIKAAIAQAPAHPAFYWLVTIAVVGVVISLYYYMGVVRVIFWSKEATDFSPVRTSTPIRFSLYACIAGMLFLGLVPGPVIRWATEAVISLPTIH